MRQARHTRAVTYTGTLAAAAVKVAASLGMHATDPVIHYGDGQVMSFWRYLSPSGQGLPGPAI
jgi:hypothetical protein